MILVFFFVLVLLFCLPLLHSATTTNASVPICPESFCDAGVGPFKYPFYNVTDTRCGLIKVTCTSNGGEIKFGGRSYEIVGKYESDYNSSDSFYNIVVRNETFHRLVKSNSCEALMNSFTYPSPDPQLYSTSVFFNMTFFKCKNNCNSTQDTEAYFSKNKYNSYKRCKDHNFYYNYLNRTVPSDLPHTCQVVQLPVNWSAPHDETNIFSLLSSQTSVFFKLSSFCKECLRKGQHCDNQNGQLKCFDVKNVKPNPEQTDIAKLQSKDRKIKILVIIAGLAVIVLLSIVIFIIWHHCKKNPFSYVSSKNKTANLEDISLSCGVCVFSYTELEDATQNFDPSHELGDGGFGAVYYGKLKDGREVAVKKLHEHNYNRAQQFRNEVKILTKLRHPNLVVLYGCTYRQSRELVLVYEYVPNGTVFDHLHGGQGSTQTLLTWPIRLNIAIETASALAYLHASEIIHRDVKTSNILLDHNFSVKVADFGLSRLVPSNVSHVSTAPQGTPGYVDPQYHQRYQLTDKSDVYSFGVVLIELISSMVVVDLNRSKEEIGLANFALNKIQRCEVDKLIDPLLGCDKNLEIKNMITSVAELAFQCLQYDSEMRPTMNEVLDVLMYIQAGGEIKAYDSSRDFQSTNVTPLSETNDAVVLLKDFSPSPVSLKDLLPSPISVTSEWQSNNSVSTTLSNREDKLS